MVSELAGRVSKEWGWLLAGSVISIFLGFFAWQAPYAASQAVVFILGWVLVLSGLVQLIQAVRLYRLGGMSWRLFQSCLSIIGGIIMLRAPAIGLIGVSLTIIFYLFLSSAAQWLMGMALRSVRGAGWLFFSSVISFILGVVLIAQFPASAFYTPGLFLALDLIVGGITLMGLSFRLREIHKGFRDLPSVKSSRAA